MIDHALVVPVVGDIRGHAHRAGPASDGVDLRLVAAGEDDLVALLPRVCHQRGANPLAAAGNQNGEDSSGYLRPDRRLSPLGEAAFIDSR